jgi:ATP-dependent Lon protease
MAESDTAGQTMVESDTAGQTMVDAIYQKYDDVETVIHIHIPASAPGKKGSVLL